MSDNTESTPVNHVCEVEQCLLGILLCHHDKIRSVRAILDPDMFSSPLHRIIYRMILDGDDRGSPHDPLILRASLSDNYFVAQGTTKNAYIGDLVSSFVLPYQAVSYAESLVGWYHERRVAEVAASDLPEREKAEKIAVIHREIEKGIDTQAISVSTALENALNRIEEVYRKGGGFIGLPTGLTDLDRMLCGLEDGGLYTLAGRPAMGKTAAALTIAMNAAMNGRFVVFFSLEMSAEQLSNRLYARYADTTMWAQRNGPPDLNFAALEEARARLKAAHMTIIDKGGLTASQIVAKASDIAAKRKPALIVIDHLGIVAARDPAMPRVYQVSEMTMLFKTLARELKCPVLLLHQLNRGVESRDDKRPTLSDLRDSGSVEQDSDAVMLLYREEYYLRKEPERRENEQTQSYDTRLRNHAERLERSMGVCEIMVAKNRQGETGTVYTKFDGRRQVFENLEGRK